MSPKLVWLLWIMTGMAVAVWSLRFTKRPEISGTQILFSGSRLYLEPSHYLRPSYRYLPASLLVAVPIWAALGLWIVSKLR
jgi:hypothetical protein